MCTAPGEFPYKGRVLPILAYLSGKDSHHDYIMHMTLINYSDQSAKNSDLLLWWVGPAGRRGSFQLLLTEANPVAPSITKRSHTNSVQLYWWCFLCNLITALQNLKKSHYFKIHCCIWVRSFLRVMDFLFDLQQCYFLNQIANSSLNLLLNIIFHTLFSLQGCRFFWHYSEIQ